MSTSGQAIERRVAALYGLEVPRARHSRLLQVVDEIAESNRISSHAAEQMICREPQLLLRVVQELLIHESFFMRHAAQLEVACRHVVERLESSSAPVHVWSAGCCRGEEVYSLVMLLQQRVPQSTLRERVVLRGTDLDGPSIAQASRGQYGTWSLRGLSPELISRFFVSGEGGHRLSESTRSLVSFEHTALHARAARTPANVLDVVLFRNVAIYLTDEALKSLYAELCRAMRPEALLVLAPTDPKPSSATFRPLPEGEPACWQSSAPGAAYDPGCRVPRSSTVDRDSNVGRGLHSEAGYLLDAAQVSLAEGDFRVAAAHLRRALYLDPNHVLARFWYVTALRRLASRSRYEQQKALLLEVLERRPPGACAEDGKTAIGDLRQIARAWSPTR